jgi:hypothetical protein
MKISFFDEYVKLKIICSIFFFSFCSRISLMFRQKFRGLGFPMFCSRNDEVVKLSLDILCRWTRANGIDQQTRDKSHICKLKKLQKNQLFSPQPPKKENSGNEYFSQFFLRNIRLKTSFFEKNNFEQMYFFIKITFNS